jgi:hypothetical protein
MDEDWLYKSSSSVSFSSYLDDIIVYFQTMPQTTSAVALWVVKLDALIAPYLDKPGTSRALALKEPVQTSKYLFTITIVNAFEVWIYCIFIVIVFSTVNASGISCNLVFRK